MIISRTPFRMSLFGGGTDYPSWYRRHGGAVLVSSINKYCYITARYLPPFFEHRLRLVYSRTETCQRLDEIQHPAAREVLRHLGVEHGVEIHHDGDLPARSGIGSSSAFTVGLLHALHALQGHMPSPHQLAVEGIRIEQEVLREAVGSQDQVAAAYGGFIHVRFDRSGEITVRPITLPLDRIAELNAHLMMFYTGIPRIASDVAASYAGDLHEREPEMQVISSLVDEALASLNSRQDVGELGALLHQSWRVKQRLSGQVSSSVIEAIYEDARSAGALGGKIMGAGGGGFMLLFVPPAARRAVRERLRGLLHVPFKLETTGSRIIFYDPEESYDPDEIYLAEAERRVCVPAAIRDTGGALAG